MRVSTRRRFLKDPSTQRLGCKGFSFHIIGRRSLGRHEQLGRRVGQRSEPDDEDDERYAHRHVIVIRFPCVPHRHALSSPSSQSYITEFAREAHPVCVALTTCDDLGVRADRADPPSYFSLNGDERGATTTEDWCPRKLRLFRRPRTRSPGPGSPSPP
ncbi:hypothetical protein C8R46DRAFT_1140854 [Mycena filopes]|nr:hypothetical protein C8R46DRAFT_1140854 [Mycena filopes]